LQETTSTHDGTSERVAAAFDTALVNLHDHKPGQDKNTAIERSWVIATYAGLHSRVGQDWLACAAADDAPAFGVGQARGLNKDLHVASRSMRKSWLYNITG